MVEITCLAGIAASGLGLLSPGLKLATLCYVLYLSLYVVGQTFFTFQWDILLLETGVLGIVVAAQALSTSSQTAAINLRWLLFKLMFMSGVVKLQAECPTWLGLTALHYHYATQCLPTPLAWFAHQLPDIVHKTSVAVTFFIEIPATFLILAPTKFLRLVGAVLQVVLQVAIILTGNYNFFNLLTCLLCVPVVSDFFEEGRPSSRSTRCSRFSGVFNAAGIGLLALSIPWMFRVAARPEAVHWWDRYDLLLNISLADLTVFLRYALPASFVLVGCLFVHAAWVQMREAGSSQVTFLAAVSSVWTLIWIVAAALVLAATLPDIARLEPRTNRAMPRVIDEWHGMVHSYGVTSGYGLFRHMTGVGPASADGRPVVARPEIIIEGSNDGRKWLPYEFLYKPGNVSRPDKMVAPHQPRLDWQMWFAALGSYQHNPWFVHLCAKLLAGSPDVKALLDAAHDPFPKAPPQQIRATLYHYDYTSWGANTTKWWKRSHVREYLPPLTRDNESLQQFLKQSGWHKVRRETDGSAVAAAVRMLRSNALSAAASATALLVVVGIVRFIKLIMMLRADEANRVKRMHCRTAESTRPHREGVKLG